MNCAVSDISFSDHNLVSFGVGLQLYKGNLTCSLNFRNITGIDLSVLSPCIDNLMTIDASASTNDLVSHYNNGLVKLSRPPDIVTIRSLSAAVCNEFMGFFQCQNCKSSSIIVLFF